MPDDFSSVHNQDFQTELVTALEKRNRIKQIAIPCLKYWNGDRAIQQLEHGSDAYIEDIWNRFFSKCMSDENIPLPVPDEPTPGPDPTCPEPEDVLKKPEENLPE